MTKRSELLAALQLAEWRLASIARELREIGQSVEQLAEHEPETPELRQATDCPPICEPEQGPPY